MLTGLIFLYALRLLLWKCFPSLGQGDYAEIVFGLFVLTWVTLYGVSKTRSQFHLPLFLLTLAYAISFFHSASPLFTIRSLFMHLVYVLLFVLAVKELRTEKRVKTLWTVLLIGAAASALLGISEFIRFHFGWFPPPQSQGEAIIYGMKRACSFQGWPLSFAGYLILFIPSVFMTWHIEKQRWAGWVLLILLLGLLTSKSLFPVVSLGVAFLLILPLLTSNYLIPASGVLALLGIGVFALSNKGVLSSFDTRIDYYTQAFYWLAQHPVLGTGLGSFSATGASKSLFVHNTYLQIWLETGLFGLAAILSFLGAFWKAQPQRDSFRIGLWCGLAAVLIDNLFSYTLLKSNLSFVFWIALACFATIYDIKKGEDNANNSWYRSRDLWRYGDIGD